MMRVITTLIWIPAGILLAHAVLKFQRWSVNVITPDHRKRSYWLVVGGAIIRWMAICLGIILALSDSIISALVLFFTFMIARLVILNRWEKNLSAGKSLVN